jgi:hypothetical protein
MRDTVGGTRRLPMSDNRTQQLKITEYTFLEEFSIICLTNTGKRAEWPKR